MLLRFETIAQILLKPQYEVAEDIVFEKKATQEVIAIRDIGNSMLKRLQNSFGQISGSYSLPCKLILLLSWRFIIRFYLNKLLMIFFNLNK